MRSRSVIVIQIRTKDTTERAFVEHEHMVQTLAPNRTNHALDVGPLPGGSRGAQHFVHAHVSHLSPEGIAEDSITVAQQVARKLIKGERFSQLLSGPLRYPTPEQTNSVKGAETQLAVSTTHLSKCVRFGFCFRSFTSLLRPRACLFVTRSSREMKFTGTPKKVLATLFPHASGNSTPVISVKMSIRTGAIPI